MAGWGEFELEVIRDRNDNVVVICSIENVDPMGVHTGDSVTVAPAQTLTDREYQVLRDASAKVIRAVGVETGGSNVQFALNRDSGELVVIEMNPRVSRSSGARIQGHRLPDRQGRHQARGRLHAGRDPQRHHRHHAGVVRAGARLRGGQAAPLRVREVPRRRRRADHADEVGGRGDGHRPQLLRGLGQGHAQPRAGRRRAHPGLGGRRLLGPLRRDRVAPAGGRQPSGAGRRVEGAPLVPGRVVARERRRAGAGRCRRGGGRGRMAAPEAPRHLRRPHRRADRRRRAGGAPRPARRRRAARIQGRRQLRRRGGGAGPVLLLGLRAGGRAAPRRPRERRDPGRRSQPHRPGHRVRLLLCAGCTDLPLPRVRRGDGELQPRDGVNRRRLLRPALLRAADGRGRARGDRARTPDRRRRPVRRPDAAGAGAPARGGGREAPGHAVRGDRRGRGSGAVRKRAG